MFSGGFLARKPRTVKLCPPGTGARLGALGVWRVRKLRAMEGHSFLILDEIKSEHEESICNLARRSQLDYYGRHP